MHFFLFVADTYLGMYLDMAFMLMSQIQKEGHTAQIVKCVSQDHYQNAHMGSFIDTCDIRLMKIRANTQVIVFGNLYTTCPWIVPPGAVLTIFDCTTVMKNITSNFLRDNVILHYTPTDCDLFRERVPEAVIAKFNFAYTPYLDFATYDTKKEYDAVFIGNLSERRSFIIDRLRQAGLTVECFRYYITDFCTGLKRALLYSKAKVVLSMFANEHTRNNTLASRVVPAVCTGAFVVSEASNEEELNDDLKDVCHLTSYDNMVHDVLCFVYNEAERESKRLQFYTNMKQKQQVCDISILTSKSIL